MKYELKSFNVWSVARTIFIVTLLIHLLLGLTGSAFILLGVNALNNILDDSDVYYEDYAPEDSKFPLFAIFVFIISIGLSFGYMILSAVAIIIYNNISKIFGGIEVNLNELSQLKKTKLIPKAAKDPEEEETLS